MEPGLSELGTWNTAGTTWETGATAGVAAAEVGTGAVVIVVVLSGVASIVGATLAGVGAVASVGAVMEEGRSGIGAVVVKGGAGDGALTVAAVVSASAARSGTTRELALSAAGSVTGSFSGGDVDSGGCGGAFGSSEESEEDARRLLKEVGKAEAVELGWGTEKAGLGFDSGGLTKLPEAAPLDRSTPVESSADFWRPAPKLNCAAPVPIPSPVSPKPNEAAAGLVDESLASSPWPTRSPEKLPRVSPPIILGGCGSILRAVVVEVGLSPDVCGGRVGDAVPRAGEVDFGVRENGSSPAWPNINLLVPPKENLFTSFTGET